MSSFRNCLAFLHIEQVQPGTTLANDARILSDGDGFPLDQPSSKVPKVNISQQSIDQVDYEQHQHHEAGQIALHDRSPLSCRSRSRYIEFMSMSAPYQSAKIPIPRNAISRMTRFTSHRSSTWPHVHQACRSGSGRALPLIEAWRRHDWSPCSRSCWKRLCQNSI